MSRAALPASTIGNYQILKVLGKGSTATVYLGLHPTTGQNVAIKVIPGRVVNDRVLSMRFAKECQVARQLDHPHVVHVLDYGLDGYKPYLVMEFVGGGSLGQRLEREGRLAGAEAVEIITQTGRALQWAHERRLVHRDVKPDNILLGADGKVKLSDLGLVKSLDDDAYLTQALDYLGTPNFTSPEQFNDPRTADARSDLYSLAATLYMTVTGEIPFRGRNGRDLAGILKRKLEGDIAPPRQLVPELSERVNDAILQALEVDCKKRQGSVREFLESLTEKTVTIRSAPANSPMAAEAEIQGGAGNRNRRSKKRYPSQISITCNKLQKPPPEPWVTKVLDISETGICLELNRRFERGVLLKILLEEGPILQHSVVACVMWVKQLAPKSWKVGCRFARPISEIDIQDVH
ncbi:MAG TPA: serine/threonine-protein kinase [Gemmataceae bacterium]|jgi:serine/threonine protein kinase|nr:serine/threonine-protein kinase [Gemmataceae bacterium]